MNLSHYLDVFIDESLEHLYDLNKNLLKLENEPNNPDIINDIFRAAHSLKGIAGTMGFDKIQSLTHIMEDSFFEIRCGNLDLSQGLFDLLFEGLDVIAYYLRNIEETGDEGDLKSQEIGNMIKDHLESQRSVRQINKDPSDKKTTKDNGAYNNDINKSISGLNKYKQKNLSKQIQYEDYDCRAVVKAEEIGLKNFIINISLSSTCVLKAARVFIILRELEQIGEIIKFSPPISDLTNENFDTDFSLILITEEGHDQLNAVLEQLEEIDSYAIELIRSKDIRDRKKDRSEGKEQEQLEEVSLSPSINKIGRAKDKKPRPKVNRYVRVELDKLDDLTDLASELSTVKNHFNSIGHSKRLESLPEFYEALVDLERLTKSIHESIMRLRMISLENIFKLFPRMVRDLSKKLNKKVQLLTSGEKIEIDRNGIDEISDAVLHLIRNAMDHGIESKEVRQEQGKAEIARISLKAYQEGNTVIIEVEDDGRGISIREIRQRLVDKGLYSMEELETLDKKALLDFIFYPSFSTSDTITEISGRGVGLDIVKSNLKALGASIEVKTKEGFGTRFIIKIPRVLTLTQAIITKVGKEKYAIPTTNIELIEEINLSNIRQEDGKHLFNLMGEDIEIIYITDLVELDENVSFLEEATLLIVLRGDQKIGLVIGEYLSQQEILVRPLGKYINSDPIISGATILDSGELVLILEPSSLLL